MRERGGVEQGWSCYHSTVSYFKSSEDFHDPLRCFNTFCFVDRQLQALSVKCHRIAWLRLPNHDFRSILQPKKNRSNRIPLITVLYLAENVNYAPIILASLVCVKKGKGRCFCQTGQRSGKLSVPICSKSSAYANCR